MSDKDSPATGASNQDDGDVSSRSDDPNSDPRSQSNPAPSDSGPAPTNAADGNRVVVDILRSPPPTATPIHNGVANPPPRPQQHTPATPQHQQQSHQPYPQNGPPMQQNVQRPLRPIYPSGQSPLPQSYVVHPQAPLLMDRCPRCQFVPTLQQGQQPPPLPPYGSYLPANVYPPPPNWPQPPAQRPPPPTSPQSQSQTQPQPQSQSQSQPTPSPASPHVATRCRLQVPPEFRSTKYFPGWGKPPPPPHVQAQMTPPAAHVNGLPAEDIPDYLPDDPNGHVLEPFIPPPKYAPVPSAEAIAFLAPKWPKPPKEPRVVTADSETRREKQRRIGRQRLTRDQRRDVLLMRRLGYQFESIARFLGTTISACHYTCRKGTPEVGHKNAGRRVRMPADITTRMCEYVKEYQKQERAAGKDRKTGKRKMQMLTYKMIRDNVFRNEHGEIPDELKYTDDALKQLLNKYGLWLRQPMSEARKAEGRARGIRQWKEKLAKDRAEAQKLAAEATAAGQPVSEELAALANGTAVVEEPGSDMEGYGSPGDDDEEMEEAYSATDDTPSDHDDNDDHESMQIEDQLRQAIAAPENYR